MSLMGGRRPRQLAVLSPQSAASPTATTTTTTPPTTASNNGPSSSNHSGRRRPTLAPSSSTAAGEGGKARPLSNLLSQLADFNLDDEQDSSAPKPLPSISEQRPSPSSNSSRSDSSQPPRMPPRRYDRSAAAAAPAPGRYERAARDRDPQPPVPLPEKRYGSDRGANKNYTPSDRLSPSASRGDRDLPTVSEVSPSGRRRIPEPATTKKSSGNTAGEDDGDWLLGDADGADALADLLSKSKSRTNNSVSGRSATPSERSGRSGYTSRTNPEQRALRSQFPGSAGTRNYPAQKIPPKIEGPIGVDSTKSYKRPGIETSPVSSSPRNGMPGAITSFVPRDQPNNRSPESPQSLPTNGNDFSTKYNESSTNGFKTPLMQMIASTRMTSPFIDRSLYPQGGEMGLFRRNSQKTTSSSASATIDLSDPKVIQQLINIAVSDSEGFQIMQIDKIEEKRRQLLSYSSQVGSLQNKIGLESRIRDAAESMIRSGISDSIQLDTSRQQLVDTTRKMEDIAADTWKAVFNLVDTERTLFMHISGVLRWQLLEQQQAANAYPDSSTIRAANDAANRKQLASAESRTREMEQYVDVLKNTISRLELEQEPLRQLASEAQRDLRRIRDDRSAMEESLRKQDDQPTQLDVNRLRLDLATCRADITDLREELSEKKTALANLQLQLEDDQSLIESKDRMISNLLGELEEATTQLEIYHAGGKVTIDRNRTSTLFLGNSGANSLNAKGGSSSNNNMNRVLSEQLKQAVFEQEKLKLLLIQEQEHSTDLETKLRMVRDSPPSSSSKRTLAANESSTAERISDSDTETENDASTKYSRRRGAPNGSRIEIDTNASLKGGRPPMVSEAEFKSLQRENQDQASQIDQLQRRACRFTDLDEKLLRDMNEELETYLGATSPRSLSRPRLPSPFSKSDTEPALPPLPSLQVMLGRLRDTLDSTRKSSERMRELLEQKDTLEKSFGTMQGRLRDADTESNSKLFNLRRDYDALQDELAVVSSRLHDSERLVTDLQEIKMQYEDTSRKLSVAESEVEQFRVDSRAKAIASEREIKDEAARQLSKWERDRERLKTEHQHELDEIQRSMLKETEQATKRLEREIEQVKSTAEQRIQDAVDIEVSSISRKHQYEMEDLGRLHDQVKSDIEKRTVEEMLEIRRRLETAESGLVTSKQQFFVERERLQERIDQVQEEARTLRAQATERSNEWLSKKAELDSNLNQMIAERDDLASQLELTRGKLDEAVAHMSELNTRGAKEVESLRAAHATKVSQLEDQLNEYKSLEDELAAIERSTNEKLAQQEEVISQLNVQLIDEQHRATDAVSRSQEAQAEASDQLHRVERLHREAERDIDRYRRLADEKDDEVLVLKKSLRQKEKELLDKISGAATRTPTANNSSPTSGDPGLRRLLEQKDRDIESARSETRAALADIAVLKRKVELKDREIEDVKSEMRRKAKTVGDKDAMSDEVDRLQIMLMELKTSRVQLLEELDNREHCEHVLKAEVASLKAKL
ncbi:hypothetical protein BASA50_003900 [Batrachochytrium salamandrivorans]|uniref:Up-regulated during septation protein 1 domain-containing protein n=1 Tax=Batrachochytrium salamandrivorans TaxID=1357716 RepID=A0ABQ8FHC7_9FUNG|nr:hypothetical protein BASA50_003900 [Batrachochytrium salamandrivorans]